MRPGLCTGLLEPLLVIFVISTLLSCAGAFNVLLLFLFLWCYGGIDTLGKFPAFFTRETTFVTSVCISAHKSPSK